MCLYAGHTLSNAILCNTIYFGLAMHFMLYILCLGSSSHQPELSSGWLNRLEKVGAEGALIHNYGLTGGHHNEFRLLWAIVDLTELLLPVLATVVARLLDLNQTRPRYAQFS